MLPRRPAIAGSAWLGALLTLACAAVTDPPNVLLLVVDTLRADHLSLYGYERTTTRHLDAFARGGLIFDNARASSSWTKPAMATLLTGLSASQHGVEARESRLPESVVTLAEAFGAAGYRTALFSDNPYIARPFGFAQGYQQVLDYSNRESNAPSQQEYTGADGARFRTDEASDWVQGLGARFLNRQLSAWLEQLADGAPWFAHVHYMETHWPYDPPVAFRNRFREQPVDWPLRGDLAGLEPGLARSLPGTSLDASARQELIDVYDGSIAFWDHLFGRLILELEQAGRLDDTIVVVVSDHGEAFYEHETWAHQNSLYDELVRVPLVLRGPGISPGRVNRHVSVAALPSTLLGLAGLDSEALARAESLFDEAAPAWTARLDEEGRVFHATIDGDEKWLFSERAGQRIDEAYDLHDDPGEQRDQATATRAEGIRARLLARSRAERAEGLAPETVEISGRLDEALRAIGYVE